jgi:glycosyltransferase 2 family protein
VKNPIRIIGGVLITVFFLWLAVRNVDIAAIRDALRHASYRYLIPAAIFCATGYLLRTLRWQRILAPTKQVPFSRLFPVLMTGFAANNLLPARIGEFVRAYLLSRRERVSGSLALATIVLERVCDGLMLILLMTGTILVAPVPVDDPKIDFVESAAAIIFGVAALAIVLLLFVPRPILAVMRFCLRPLPHRIAARITGLMDAFIAGLEALRSPLEIAKIAVLAALIWACEAATFGSVLLAFPLGLERSEWVAAALFLLVFVNLGIMIPSAPGYIGTYQLFAKMALGAFAVSAASGVALSFVVHALQYSIVTSIGLICLWRLGLSPRTLGELSTADSSADAVAGEPIAALGPVTPEPRPREGVTIPNIEAAHGPQ